MQQVDDPKIYCPQCGSYSVFIIWIKLTQWALCRGCWYKRPADEFRVDYDYWDQVVDWVKENKLWIRSYVFYNTVTA